MAPQVGARRASQALLAAGSVRVRLRVVDDDPVIQVGHVDGHVLHEVGHPRHVRVVDVLGLVTHLVVVPVQAGARREGWYGW